MLNADNCAVVNEAKAVPAKAAKSLEVSAMSCDVCSPDTLTTFSAPICSAVSAITWSVERLAIWLEPT